MDRNKTAKQIFNENMKRDNYWFNRNMKEFERIMSRNKEAKRETVQEPTQFSFTDAEMKYLISLCD